MVSRVAKQKNLNFWQLKFCFAVKHHSARLFLLVVFHDANPEMSIWQDIFHETL